MFETLIAILVVSLGVVGFMELLKFSLRNNDSAVYRAQAAFLSSEIMERMRANRTEALAKSYNGACNGPGDDEDDEENEQDASGISVSVVSDLAGWCTNVAATLPQGDGEVLCNDGVQSCEVTIRWDDSRGTAGAANQAFVVRSLL